MKNFFASLLRIFVKMINPDKWIGYNFPQDKFPEGTFDFITLWGVLEHLKNPLFIMSLLSKKLNSDGMIVITTVGIDTGIPYRYRYPEHLVWWSNKSIYTLAEKIGMEVIDLHNYYMYQDPSFYLDRVLDRGCVPKSIRELISINAKEFIYVPTNEIFIVLKKKD